MSLNAIIKHTDVIGYKICYIYNKLRNNFVLIKLRIPHNAIIIKSKDHKLRTNLAQVLNIWAINIFESQLHKLDDTEIAFSIYDPAFKYQINKIIIPNTFDSSNKNTCSPGIHFFLNSHDALSYSGLADMIQKIEKSI
ncbi:MAG: pentapeptide repeat-containing protein [Gaeavirus sp.]|uniref:Pentapeptide repeat-containing protein n=1 Tax=Gaeavirus sp. TaxID=2487767 RepID=A0A3G4ZYW3_9VIRU|nr:MAG: pentapeptide repeat-containing protein [Gaeavirus sp.]